MSKDKQNFLLQQQLRRTDPVYASMTSHNVSTSSTPSPPSPNERQTPPPETVTATKCYLQVLPESATFQT